MGQEAEGVWNEDKTGCFHTALPDKTLCERHQECKGKERLTIAFFVNAAGGKEPPVVIGRVAKPTCFKVIKKNSLLSQSYGMDDIRADDIYTEVLNKPLVKQKRIFS